MRNFAARLLLALFFLAPLAHEAKAQSTGRVVADCTTGVPLAYPVGSTSLMTMLADGRACANVAVTASVTGFPTTQSTGTPISVTTSSGAGNLPAGTVIVASNVGATNGAYCKLGATATTSDQLIPPNSWFAFTVGSATQLACITSTSTTTVNMVGGSGLPTGSGGGGGGSGGGAITAASGSYSSGALSSGSVASGAFASGALASGSVASGAMVDLGAQADSAAAADTSTASLIALLKRNNQNLTTINTSVGAAIPAGTNLIGKVGFDQTTPGTTNGVQVNAALPAGTNTIGTVGQLTYPVGATPITASATGTTGATTATLAGTGGKTTYICGYSIRANATAAATVTNTITGVITATLSSIMWIAPLASGIGVDEQIFSPCIPASGTNQAIAVVSGAPGSGGTVSSRGWGYQL